MESVCWSSTDLISNWGEDLVKFEKIKSNICLFSLENENADFFESNFNSLSLLFGKNPFKLNSLTHLQFTLLCIQHNLSILHSVTRLDNFSKFRQLIGRLIEAYCNCLKAKLVHNFWKGDKILSFVVIVFWASFYPTLPVTLNSKKWTNRDKLLRSLSSLSHLFCVIPQSPSFPQAILLSLSLSLSLNKSHRLLC